MAFNSVIRFASVPDVAHAPGHASSGSRVKLKRGAVGLILATLVCKLAAQPVGYLHDPSGNVTAITQTVPAAPTFILPPPNQVVTENGTAYFSLLATGPGPLSYQWLSNGVVIPGATGDVLAVPSVVVPVNLV